MQSAEHKSQEPWYQTWPTELCAVGTGVGHIQPGDVMASGKPSGSHLVCKRWLLENQSLALYWCSQQEWDSRSKIKQVIIESQNTRLEGTSRIIWSNLSWQKQGLDKMAQHPVQLNLKPVQCWRIHHILGRLFQWSIVLIVKNFPPVSSRISQGLISTHYPSSSSCDSL